MKSVFTDEYKLLLEHLILARKSAKITQQGLAQQLGKPQSFVSKYERGERRIDVIEFLKVTRAIGVDPYQLLEAIEESIPGTTIKDAQ